MNFDFIYHEGFWKDTLGRTLYTMAEALVGCIGGATVFDVDWKASTAIILTAGVVTALKCFIVACRNGFDRVEETTVEEIEDLLEEDDDEELM